MTSGLSLAIRNLCDCPLLAFFSSCLRSQPFLRDALTKPSQGCCWLTPPWNNLFTILCPCCTQGWSRVTPRGGNHLPCPLGFTSPSYLLFCFPALSLQGFSPALSQTSSMMTVRRIWHAVTLTLKSDRLVSAKHTLFDDSLPQCGDWQRKLLLGPHAKPWERSDTGKESWERRLVLF